MIGYESCLGDGSEGVFGVLSYVPSDFYKGGDQTGRVLMIGIGESHHADSVLSVEVLVDID